MHNESAPPAHRPSEPQANILLVDDRPANLVVLRAILDDLGHNLVDAASGPEALRLLEVQDFAMVLLDVRLPGMDGFETAQYMRSRERTRHTPIIFLTAYDDNRLSVEEAYALGAVDYLTKPLVPVILRAKVAGFVELFQKTEQVKQQAEQLRQLERQEFERALAEKNARYRALTEHSSDAVTLVRADGTVLYNSPSSERVLGYRPEEFVGCTAFELVHPEDRDRARSRLVELVQKPGTPMIVEMRIRHKDGSWRWVECVGTNLLAEPAVEAIVINFRDITERQQATEALRQSERRFAQFMEHLPGLAWIKDPDGRYLYVNDAAAKAFARPRTDLYGKTDEELFPPEVAAQFRENDQRGLADSAGVQVVETLLGEDGILHHSIVNKFPIPGTEGDSVLVGGMAVDITDRLRAENELRRSEEQFHTLADSIPQLAWMTRPDGYIFWYNRRWYDYTGTTPAQVDGWGWEALHDPAELPRVLRNWRAALASGEPWEDIFPLRRHDGAMRWHLSRAVPLRDSEGRVLRWFGTNTDITERLQMEEALKEADRRKDEFLAMLAHELRNPLAPIRNAVHVLRLLGSGDLNVRRANDMIERQVQHLARLVDDLLDVSRITRGKITLHPVAVGLAMIIARATETVHPLITHRRHELTVTLPKASVWVEADVTRLAQVVANLLSNAAKYTAEGGHIWLTVEQEGSQAVVRVRDNGMGISADLLPHVFELFTQGDHSLARSEGGLGIGLTLVQRLVEMHGGSVEAHSAGPRQGSEFVVRLPAVQGPPELLVEDGGPECYQRPLTLRRRVLVVDDNLDAAESLASLLRVGGHEVRTVHDGPTALQMAETFRPEVVLLDIGLPRMDGYEVARRLRQQTAAHKVLLVAVTGYGQEEDRQRAEEAGFDAHLVKPADPEIMNRLVCTGRTAS
jgi:PAS domain S-box-containing protein